MALERGAKIGPAGIASAFFGSYAGLVAGTNNTRVGNESYYSRGYWAGNLKNRYLGVRFQLKGQTHYGWIRLTVTTNVKSGRPSLEATITGYAYETIPGKSIIAGATKGPDNTEPTASLNTLVPEPASLGVLALGAPGLSIWRREKAAAGTVAEQSSS